MIRKIIKFFAWLIGGLIGLFILFYLVVLAINWRDVPPSKEAIRFAQIYASRPHVADEHNAFVFMVGMAVTPEHDPMQAGIAMIEAARMNAAEGVVTEYSHPAYQQLQFRDSHNKETQEFIDSCKSLDEKCLVLHGKSLPDIQSESMDAVLLNRYRDLIGLSEWQDVYPRGLSGPMPPFGPAMSGQIVSMLDIWKNAKARGAKTTIAMLDADARFWRMVLVSSDSLITSMVAVSALKKNLYWTNIVIKSLSNNNATVDLPPTWLNPITDEERLMVRTWTGEWALGEPMIRNFPERLRKEQESSDEGYSVSVPVVRGLIRPLYQPQDSINRHAQDLAALLNDSSVDYEQLPEVITKRKGSLDSVYEEVVATPRIFYNPIGKLKFYFEKPDFEIYIVGVPNLEGARRALLAVHQLRIRRTTTGKIKGALESSSYRNPYNSQPFVWEATSGSVVFEGLGVGKRKRYSFVY